MEGAREVKRSKPSATVEPAADRSGVRGAIARLSPRPAADGPSVRLGILWFLVALAAVTAGRWPTAVLWTAVAVVAARELVVAWWSATSPTSTRAPATVVATAMLLAAPTPIAAALGRGFAGAILVLVVAALAVVLAASATSILEAGPAEAAGIVVAVLLPTLTAVSVVLVTAAHLWAGIFLVVAVSLYDAGYHIGAAESSSLLEGPVTGAVGALAVTFTMATFQAPPFQTASAAIAGCLVALCCPLGQWASSALLPSPEIQVRAVRRMDAYVLAAPVMLAVAWFIT